MQILKKITAKTVCGTINKPEKATDIMRVYGIGTGIKTGSTNFGPWAAVTGNIKAVNLATGEEFQAGAAILPDVANNLIIGAVQNSDNNAVDFAFDIGIKPSDSPVGYDFTCTPLVDTGDSDPLAQLESKLPKLPAPAPAKK